MEKCFSTTESHSLNSKIGSSLIKISIPSTRPFNGYAVLWKLLFSKSGAISCPSDDDFTFGFTLDPFHDNAVRHLRAIFVLCTTSEASSISKRKSVATDVNNNDDHHSATNDDSESSAPVVQNRKKRKAVVIEESDDSDGSERGTESHDGRDPPQDGRNVTVSQSSTGELVPKQVTGPDFGFPVNNVLNSLLALMKETIPHLNPNDVPEPVVKVRVCDADSFRRFFDTHQKEMKEVADLLVDGKTAEDALTEFLVKSCTGCDGDVYTFRFKVRLLVKVGSKLLPDRFADMLDPPGHVSHVYRSKRWHILILPQHD